MSDGNADYEFVLMEDHCGNSEVICDGDNISLHVSERTSFVTSRVTQVVFDLADAEFLNLAKARDWSDMKKLLPSGSVRRDAGTDPRLSAQSESEGKWFADGRQVRQTQRRHLWVHGYGDESGGLLCDDHVYGQQGRLDASRPLYRVRASACGALYGVCTDARRRLRNHIDEGRCAGACDARAC